MIDLIIVEDNPLDVHLYKRALEKELGVLNYKILVDGEEALLYFQNQLNQIPKLIILDIKLPKIDGFELLSQLRKQKNTSFLPVLMLSSSNQVVDIKKAYEIGVNGFMTKPDNYEGLKKALKAISDYWLGQNKTINNE